MKKHSLGVVCLALIFIFSGCRYLLPMQPERKQPPLIKPPEVEFDLYEVKSDTLEILETGSAVVETEKNEIIWVIYNNPLILIDVHVNQTVKKGDLLFKQKKSDRMQEFYSPIDGVITEIRSDMLKPDYLGYSIDLIHIADPSKIEIRYYGNADHLKAGMEVRLEPNSGKKLKAKIKKVADSVNPYTVFELLESEKNTLAIGERINFYITLNRKENVFSIPKTLVKNYQGRDYVELLLPDGKKVERNIKIGLGDNTMVEITEGLNEGDKIIIR